MSRSTILTVLVGIVLAGCEKQPDPEEIIAQGKATFDAHCVACHGPDGDVRAADQYDPATPDLRTIASRSPQGRMPRVMLTEIIDGRRVVQAHGNRTMPVWGEALGMDDGGSADEKIDALVKYVESIQNP
ncbi:MAG: cytochrome c [Pseudomonadota bacterium]